MTITIEVACTHNNGRSPLAHAFAEKYIQERGIEGYKIVSSGSNVNEINMKLEGIMPFTPEELIFAAKLARKSGYPGYNPSWNSALDNPHLLSPEDWVAMNDFGLDLNNHVVEEETGYRATAFEKFNLGQPRNSRVQTVVRPDTNLWLGMGKSNVAQAQRIYARAERRPVFDTLAGYATRTPGAEFKSGFGGTLNDYLEMAETIRGHTERAMERVVAEFGTWLL